MIARCRFLILSAALLLPIGCASDDHESAKSSGGSIAGNVAGNTVQAESDTARAANLIRDNHLEDARKLLERAITADPMYGPAHNDLGIVNLKQSQVYPAAIEFRSAIKLMPRQSQPMNNLGLVLEEAGKYREAEQYFGQAMAIDPDNIEYVGNLARVKVRLGETDKSLTDLLSKIVLYDSRPEWSQWAQRMLLKESTPTTLPLALP